MSAKSQLDFRTAMLLKTLEALEAAHGFRHVLVLPPDSDVHELSMSFLGDKPIWKEYIAARVSIHLQHFRTQNLWGVSVLRINSVYLGSIDHVEDPLWHAEGIRVLEGEGFLAHSNKELAGDHFSRSVWTISCGRDLAALFESYDKTAKFLGCMPIFLG